VFVLKDSDETRFPEFNVFQGSAVISGGSFNVQMDTQTGATSTRSGAPTSVSVEDAGDWWRLVIVFSVTTGGTVGGRIYPAFSTTLGGSSVAAVGAITAWGVQLEAGAFAASPIRTAGAAATRALETCTFANTEVLDTGAWAVDLWLQQSSAVFGASAADSMVIARSSDSYILLQRNAGSPRFQLIANGVTTSCPAITWSSPQKLTLTIDWDAGTITVAGATTGNGTTAITGGDWTAETSDIKIGTNFISGTHLWGTISRPRAA
jgi:hypothetical protein